MKAYIIILPVVYNSLGGSTRK